MEIKIDPKAGFCSGVVRAVRMAEMDLDANGKLYCLGEIVHNEAEVNRLSKRGLQFINSAELANLKNVKVLIRAHGEPPLTYEIAKKNNITLIDASCKVVLRLQDRIGVAFDELKNKDGQLVIFGKKTHPEVIGLNGQIDFNAIIVENENELDKVDYKKPVHLFSQTTKSVHEFRSIVKEIEKRLGGNAELTIEESICKQVSGREDSLKKFAGSCDVMIFVGGANSSNAKFLFDICKLENHNAYFISAENDLNVKWFNNIKSVGISGATSTPIWQMEEVKFRIEEIVKN
jgi:4-hydroxy-3-methylbut-2-enyl diphosphate reductase